MVNFLKNISNVWKFFWVICGIYLGVSIFHPVFIQESFEQFLFLLHQISLSFVFVIIFMYTFNVLISDKLIKKYLHGNVGWKQYLLVALVGVLSTGPIYLWFAYLSRMKEQGLNEGLISLFLYNRAIKLPFIPLMIEYFSVKITVVIVVLVFLFSFLNALLIRCFFKKPLS